MLLTAWAAILEMISPPLATYAPQSRTHTDTQADTQEDTQTQTQALSQTEAETETDRHIHRVTKALVTSAAATHKYVCENANSRNKP